MLHQCKSNTVNRLLVGIGLLFGLAAFALPQPGLGQGGPPLDPHGEPKQFAPGKPAMYSIWYSQHGWHLRMTTAKKKRNFTGTIHVAEGAFTKVVGHNLEEVGPKHDVWKVGSAGHTLFFDFYTEQGVDGIDFQVGKGAKFVRFDLFIDGKHMPEHIFIGHHGHHPTTQPFVLPAYPAKVFP